MITFLVRVKHLSRPSYTLCIYGQCSKIADKIIRTLITVASCNMSDMYAQNLRAEEACISAAGKSQVPMLQLIAM